MLSRYEALPMHPTGEHSETDRGPPSWRDRICSSIPLIVFFSLLFVIGILALTLSLSFAKPNNVFVENSIYSATCIENLCLFGFSEYPRDVPCTQDRHCAAYFDPCASNPCNSEGTQKCILAEKGDYDCLCREGYGGPTCEKEIHPCDYDNPCFGKATCVKHPMDEKAFSCACEWGWMGNRCEYRSQSGDTCSSRDHCGYGGNCIRRNDQTTCHCPVGFHGLHCLDTFNVNDCSKGHCKGRGYCIDREDGYDCICKFGYIGKRCTHRFIELRECNKYCQHEGTCRINPNGLPTCLCQKGYGGVYCRIRDVSEYRRYEGGKCQSRGEAYLSLKLLEGQWFLVALKKNTYNPRDACVQLSFSGETKNLKDVMPRNDSMIVRYIATRNDTSSHYRVSKTLIDDSQTVVYPPSGSHANGTNRLMIAGTLTRLYAYPLTNVASSDEVSIEFGIVFNSKEHLVLHSCIEDKTHGYFDSLLVLVREKDDSQAVKALLKNVYSNLPYVAGQMTMEEWNVDCSN